MIYKFKNKVITHMLSIVPKNIIKFDDEIEQYNQSPKQMNMIKNIMGYDEHRFFSKTKSMAEIATYGINYLCEQCNIDKNSFDAVLYVSHSTDYITPSTSVIIQGMANLKNDIYCNDLNHACNGFTIGLIESFLLLNSNFFNKILLINGGIMELYGSPKDRGIWPSIGDAYTITIIENKDSDNIYCSNYVDGTKFKDLYIPAGGTVLERNDETAKLYKNEESNELSLNHITTNGIDLLDFVYKTVPSEINKLFYDSKLKDVDIFAYLFHQPNKYVLDMLSDKLKIDKNKLKSNITTKFGNSGSATIPLVITYNYDNEFTKNNIYKVCMTGFGTGLSCTTVIMDIGNMQYCKLIEEF